MRFDFLQEELGRLRQEGRYIVTRELQSPQGPRARVDGRQVIVLCANNYLNLAAHPKVREAARRAIEEWGVGLGCGRIVCSMTVQRELERRLAAFKHTEAALVFQTGYDTNLSAIWTLTGPDDAVVSDELNHASIIDAIRMARPPKRYVYPHKDMGGLEEALRKSRADGTRRVFVITDGVFSMDGDIAPLPGIVALAERYEAYTYVDDAHGDGVLGPTGAGIAEHFGLHGRVDVEMGTLSKAFGGVGGFIAGPGTLIEYLFQRSRPFLFSTGHLAPPIAAALIAGLEVLRTEPEILHRLWDNARTFREGLRQAGFDTGGSETPIIPVIAGEAAKATQLSRRLLEEGVFVQAFSYPVVAQGKARVRCILSAGHTADDLAEALDAFQRVGQELRMI
ncbi:MAG: glycine C-acetyltransferase [Armatimonadetes bacterium]|nr:glycine C-acetyltransferase [Armatimonadota bacterium]